MSFIFTFSTNKEPSFTQNVTYMYVFKGLRNFDFKKFVYFTTQLLTTSQPQNYYAYLSHAFSYVTPPHY